VETVEGEEAMEDDEGPPALMDDDGDHEDGEGDDSAAAMAQALTEYRTALDDHLLRFTALVESLLPRHGHFHETRGPTFGADRQRRVVALARAAIVTGSNVYGVLHAKEAAKEWTFDPAQVAEDEAFLKEHGYLSVGCAPTRRQGTFKRGPSEGDAQPGEPGVSTDDGAGRVWWWSTSPSATRLRPEWVE
jgi:hypothetical protein